MPGRSHENALYLPKQASKGVPYIRHCSNKACRKSLDGAVLKRASQLFALEVVSCAILGRNYIFVLDSYSAIPSGL